MSVEEMRQEVVGAVRVGVLGREGGAGLVVVEPAAEKVPLQNAKGHLQMIGAQGSSNSNDWQSGLVSIEEMRQGVVRSGESTVAVVVELCRSWRRLSRGRKGKFSTWVATAW